MALKKRGVKDESSHASGKERHRDTGLLKKKSEHINAILARTLAV